MERFCSFHKYSWPLKLAWYQAHVNISLTQNNKKGLTFQHKVALWPKVSVIGVESQVSYPSVFYSEYQIIQIPCYWIFFELFFRLDIDIISVTTFDRFPNFTYIILCRKHLNKTTLILSEAVILQHAHIHTFSDLIPNPWPIMHSMICGQRRFSDNHSNELGILQTQKVPSLKLSVRVCVRVCQC